MSSSTASILIKSNINQDVAAKIAVVNRKRKRRIVHRPKRMTIKAVFFDLYGVYVKYLNNEAAHTMIRKSMAILKQLEKNDNLFRRLKK